MRPIVAALSIVAFGVGARCSTLAQTAPPDSNLIIVEGQDKGTQEEETRKAIREAHGAIRQAARETNAAVAIPAPLATLKGVPGVERLFTATEVRVNVDFDNVPFKDALRKLFSDAKADYDIDEGVPAGTRVVLKAKNVRLASALQALADQAGVQWTTSWKARNEDRKFRVLYRILPAARLAGFPMPPSSIFSPQVPSAITDVPAPPFRGASFVINTMEQRRVFHCPYCRGAITTVKPRNGKGPNAEWKYCPFCGKPVDMEDGDEERAVTVGRIEPGSQVKIMVITPDEWTFNRTCSIDSAGQLRLGVHQIVVNVVGYTTGKLEQVLAAKLRNYVSEPRVTAVLVTKK